MVTPQEPNKQLVVDDVAALLQAVYPDLRKIAGRLLRRERTGHTLQRTALVHETYLRLLGNISLRDYTPESFLALAAHQMRQVLIDYGRKRGAQKRGGELTRVPLLEAEFGFARDEDSVLALNEALERLGQLEPRALAVVELKFFGGCTNAEAAEILTVSEGTVEGVWLHARLWLFRALKGAPNGAPNRPVQRNSDTSLRSELPLSTCV